MKLALLTFAFALTRALVAALTWAARRANLLNSRVWVACTRENLRTCQQRANLRADF
jgi:hypothetical protein